MAKLPEPADPTLDAVDRAVEREASKDEQRLYLGISAIGHPCRRRLWYGFRLCSASSHDADTLYRFDDGHRSEDIMAARLRMVDSIELTTHDPATGQQIGVSDHGGHFSGHLDGVIRGLIQAPMKTHVWEHKAVNEKKQAELVKLKKEKGEKNSLHSWDKIYYAQAQAYMHYMKMKRHYLTCASPGTRKVVSVRTDYCQDDAEAIVSKALDVITANEPPPKIGGPDFYICKWCEHHALCHGGAFAQVNCRTCAHSTPILSGGAAWQCGKFPGEPIPKDVQLRGCALHVYRPDLMPGELIDASEDDNSATYRIQGKTIKNGGDGYTSHQIKAGALVIHDDPLAQAIIKTFDAELVTDGEERPQQATQAVRKSKRNPRGATSVS